MKLSVVLLTCFVVAISLPYVLGTYNTPPPPPPSCTPELTTSCRSRCDSCTRSCDNSHDSIRNRCEAEFGCCSTTCESVHNYCKDCCTCDEQCKNRCEDYCRNHEDDDDDEDEHGPNHHDDNGHGDDENSPNHSDNGPHYGNNGENNHHDNDDNGRNNGPRTTPTPPPPPPSNCVRRCKARFVESCQAACALPRQNCQHTCEIIRIRGLETVNSEHDGCRRECEVERSRCNNNCSPPPPPPVSPPPPTPTTSIVITKQSPTEIIVDLDSTHDRQLKFQLFPDEGALDIFRKITASGVEKDFKLRIISFHSFINSTLPGSLLNTGRWGTWTKTTTFEASTDNNKLKVTGAILSDFIASKLKSQIQSQKCGIKIRLTAFEKTGGVSSKPSPVPSPNDILSAFGPLTKMLTVGGSSTPLPRTLIETNQDSTQITYTILVIAESCNFNDLILTFPPA